jgi:hypothetical protein
MKQVNVVVKNPQVINHNALLTPNCFRPKMSFLLRATVLVFCMFLLRLTVTLAQPGSFVLERRQDF